MSHVVPAEKKTSSLKKCFPGENETKSLKNNFYIIRFSRNNLFKMF